MRVRAWYTRGSVACAYLCVRDDRRAPVCVAICVDLLLCLFLPFSLFS